MITIYQNEMITISQTTTDVGALTPKCPLPTKMKSDDSVKNSEGKWDLKKSVKDVKKNKRRTKLASKFPVDIIDISFCDGDRSHSFRFLMTSYSGRSVMPLGRFSINPFHNCVESTTARAFRPGSIFLAFSIHITLSFISRYTIWKFQLLFIP
jgi:phosphatidate phosphatase PAH1